MGFKEWVMSEGILPATPENVAKAKAFVLRKWQERTKEWNSETRRLFRSMPSNKDKPFPYGLFHPVPKDLTDACKFCSMFAQRVFGGKIEGNHDHQYVRLPDGQVLDLTDAIGLDKSAAYRHDRAFWNNPEHRDSMASCEPRVERWVKEFTGQ